MTLQHPWGLLIWLAIPLLLILYFFKPPYIRKTVSSNYLWRLSEKYRKKRLALRASHRLLQLLLQMLIVAALGLIAAGVSVTLPGGDQELVLVLDASASMNGEDASGPLLDQAKARMLSAVSTRPLGSTVTVILADGEAKTLCQRAENTSRIRRLIQEIAPGWQADSWETALSLAEEALRRNPGAQVRLYTDHPFATAENIEIITLGAEGRWNAAVLSMDFKASGEDVTFYSPLCCYGAEREITLGLYLDGHLAAAQTALCRKDEETPVVWDMTGVGSWKTATIALAAEDTFKADNTFTLVNPAAQVRRALLAGDQTFFLEQAFRAFGDELTLTVEPAWQPAMTGYDLYAFSGFTPQALPGDGAVWLFYPDEMPGEIPLKLGDLLPGGRLSAPSPDMQQDGHSALLLNGVSPEKISLYRFRQALTWEGCSPFLLCGKEPVAFTGRMDSGFRWAALLFELRFSNLPLLTDYVALLSNLLKDTAPPLLPALQTEPGEQMAVHALPGTVQALFTDEAGETAEIPGMGEEYAFSVPHPGLYTFSDVTESAVRTVPFFARVPASESQLPGAVAECRLARSALAAGDAPSLDLTLPLAALLCALLLLEYGVYLYERL